MSEQPRLAELARTTCQTGDTDNLAYFLSTPHVVKKSPCLLLFESSRCGASNVPAAAVLVFEYKTRLGPTGVFATADGTGRRDVLAQPGMRARVAALASRTLIERGGAHIVHLAFCEEHHDESGEVRPEESGTARAAPAEAIAEQFRRGGKRRAAAEWCLLEHEIPAYLPLLESFDATLARIGRKTRANLRYYRRRAEVDLGAVFVPLAEIDREAFLAFNRECMYPMPESVAAFRYEALAAHRNYWLRGIKDRDGRWLSLVAVRRQHRYVELDWQMNRAGLPNASIGLVMRSYLIEHELAVGASRLYIEGGTPQSIGNSFLRQRIAELTVKRDSTYVRLLRRFAGQVFPPKNYVGQLLTRADLQWQRW